MKKLLSALLCLVLLVMPLAGIGEEVGIEPFEEELQEGETDLFIDVQEIDPSVDEVGEESFTAETEDESDIFDEGEEAYVAEPEGELVANASDTVAYYEDCVPQHLTKSRNLIAFV